MACRELFSCLPRSTGSDTAAGATATVSEAKPTSPGCQALRCTLAMLRVCDWALGQEEVERGEKSGRLVALSDSSTQQHSPSPHSIFFFLVESCLTKVWGVHRFLSLYSSCSGPNRSSTLSYLLTSTQVFCYFSLCDTPTFQSLSLQSVCSALWGLRENHLSCRPGDACRHCCVPPALLHL